MLMLVRSAAALATMRPVLLLRVREIGCLLETKGSSCRKSRPNIHLATSNPGESRGIDAVQWTLREYGTDVVISSTIP